MNSYMLPHGTRAVARPRSTMQTQQQPDADVDQRQPGPADRARRTGRRGRVDDHAGGRAVGADRRRPRRPVRGRDLAGCGCTASSTASSSSATTSTTTDDVNAQSEYAGQPDVDVLGIHVDPLASRSLFARACSVV